MNSERLMQFCVASMAALATLMLGTSEDSVVLPVMGVVAAITALIFTDYLRWFHLHRFVAGTAGIIAGGNAFLQSQTNGLETQFISVANLLIHLQIILLFQLKTNRIYWQLITLSLLQVVVAAALNLFVLFGPLLVLYTAFAISALLLFFINRETSPFLDEAQLASSDKRQIIRVESSGSAIATLMPESRPRKELLKVSFLRHFAVLSVSTVVVSACVFLLMPRYGDGVWRAKSAAAKTGFSGEVNLEDSGSIYESPTVVMRASFTDDTGKPYALSSEPYFRGGVLRNYVVGSGRWRRGRGDLDFEIMRQLPEPQRITSAVQQTVNLERGRGGVVFSIAPACRLVDVTPRSIKIDPETHEILYQAGGDDDPAQYSLGTFGLSNGLQSQYTPNRDRMYADRRSERELRQLPELSAAAAEIVKDIPPENVVGRARALEAHFTGGLRYKYSLDPSPDRNPEIDPVVDFALNHKTGHCQHFASALALMLRSQGIPSRIVVGYRGGIFNVVGNYYQLREMDAHAWVEAAISRDQVPGDEVLPTEGFDGDAWMRLDPTPSGDWVASNVAVSPWRQWLSDTVDYTQLLWSEYVLGLNEKRQRRAIYRPIVNAFRSLTALLFSRQVWSARWELLRDRFRGDFFTQQNARDSVIAIAVLTISFYVVRFCARWLWKLTAAWFSQGRASNRPRVEFYRRLEALLAKHGMRRESQQTPHEFALAAGNHLEGITNDTSISGIPARIVDCFYRVRFGNDRLDVADVQRLENWLEVLQKSLAGNRK